MPLQSSSFTSNSNSTSAKQLLVSWDAAAFAAAATATFTPAKRAWTDESSMDSDDETTASMDMEETGVVVKEEEKRETVVPAATLSSVLARDLLIHVCSYLEWTDVRSFSQVNTELRLNFQCKDFEYVWKLQAWRGSWKMASGNASAADILKNMLDRPWVVDPCYSSTMSLAQVLSLAPQQRLPVPTHIDSSIFAPCRWSRSLQRHRYNSNSTLNNRTTTRMIRSSLQKELEIVHIQDKNGRDGNVTVRFLGIVGSGDRSIRADAPFPQPSPLSSKQTPSSPMPSYYWRSSFFRRCKKSLERTTFFGTRAETEEDIAVPVEMCKWKPFSVPSLMYQSDGKLAWNVSPRLVSYFEVELLSPTAEKIMATSVSSSVSSSVHLQDVSLFPSPSFPYRHSNDCVAVGLATNDFALHGRMPGWDANSWGYHGDDAGLYHGAGTMIRPYGSPFGVGDVVGCGIDWVHEHIFFTINGQSLGPAFDLPTDYSSPATIDPALVSLTGEGDVHSDIFANCRFGERTTRNMRTLYPVVGIDTSCLVRVNLIGPYQYDLKRHKFNVHELTVLAALHQKRKG